MTIKSLARSTVTTDYKYQSFAAGNATPWNFVSLATQTVGAGGAASVTFSSILSTFTHLQIRGILYTSNNYCALTINSDTGTNYASHDMHGDGTNAATNAYTSRANIPLLPNSSSATANIFDVSIIDILDYTNTNKYETVRALSGYDTNGAGVIYMTSGLWMNTAVITTITLANSVGNLAQYSSFALYGVK
jgi:hypothetical protein